MWNVWCGFIGEVRNLPKNITADQLNVFKQQCNPRGPDMLWHQIFVENKYNLEAI
ncbi:hypothetical protein [Virgibacillus oceani]|uniref:Uncharacterized protein n=1 Tax=Virgibacillus oceani TaxID=1479511 RepID=A0A917H401_9BACI|nr:hypothetical protein [Virgibacillus oceani]GGG66027.1 hypothetical protein GCM10011398_07080 [Virgibacillus oceani]